MEKKTRRAGNIVLFANIFLFIIKLMAGIMSNSIAIISDAAYSFLDIISSAIIFVSIRISQKKADKEHPFGHHRAEPIAALIIAVLTGVLAFELLEEAIMRFITPVESRISFAIIFVLVTAIITKLVLSFYFRKISRETGSPAMRACLIDSKNDVMTSSVALTGVLLSTAGLENYDSFAAVIISGIILYSGYKLAMENINMLMGRSPSEEHIQRLREKARGIKGVTGVNDIRAHYVGNKLHVELHAEVDKRINTRRSHDIGKKVQRSLEKMPDINKAFIHIDPRTVKKKKINT